jgi:hypothetical protein
MPRTKQTARDSRALTPEQQRFREERNRIYLKKNREREEKQKKKYHVEVSFDEEKIRAYFAPTAPEDTFLWSVQSGIAESINDNLGMSLWKFNGDKRVLIGKLKGALGGRLYSRNIIKDWCNEGLAKRIGADD